MTWQHKTRARRILVYAPIDVTLVDGSAIWVRSICKVLSLLPDTDVDLLAFAAPTEFNKPVEGLRTQWLPSHAMFTQSGLPSLAQGGTIPPAAACDALAILEQLHTYDYVLVRGRQAAWELAMMPERRARLICYLTDVEESLLWGPQDDEGVLRLRQIIEKSCLVLCQTRQLGSLIEELAPETSQKLACLPPMVPDEVFATDPKPNKTPPLKMLYAGKFAPDWATEELLDIAAKFGTPNSRTDGGATQGLEIHIFGDKINRTGDGFVDRVKGRLQAEDGHTWHGAISRDAMLKEMRGFDIGYAFRRAALDASSEISTKLIEYAASGVAPILNRTPTHEAYFGQAYPLFANTVEELGSVIEKLISGSIDLAPVLDHARGQIMRHKMSKIVIELQNTLKRIEPLDMPITAESHAKPGLLIVTHDAKFMGDLRLKLFNDQNFHIAEAIWSRYQGGDADEAGKTLAALGAADTIFCEWALENAVFCSNHKKPGQKLIVRFHRFEMTTDIPQRIHIENVDAMVTVSTHMANHLAQTYGWPKAKIFVIPNSIDVQGLDRKKLGTARFRLGLLGALPKLKRLDLALDLLERLRSADPRFTLHVKGKMPWELPWLWNSPEQYAYYAGLFDRIQRNHHLRGAVQIDPHGPDVARWFEKIGWILSLSDVESFHLAGVEGMASGATPLVIDRPGAADIFPKGNVFSDIAAMTDYVLTKTKSVEDVQAVPEMGTQYMKEKAESYDRETVMQLWLQMLQTL